MKWLQPFIDCGMIAHGEEKYLFTEQEIDQMEQNMRREHAEGNQERDISRGTCEGKPGTCTDCTNR